MKKRSNADLIRQPKTGRKLTPKMMLFCKAYVCNGWNATKAAIEAGYSEKVAQPIASRLLLNVIIQDRIKYVREHIEENLGINREKVIREHMKLAFNSIAHLHNTWIERKDFEELSDDQKECIAEISTQTRHAAGVDQNGEIIDVEVDFVKIKLFDKQKALDSISKIMGYDAPIKQEFTGMAPSVVQFLKVETSPNDVSFSEQEIKDREGL